MSKKTLVDVFYTPNQQKRLRKLWIGRAAMFIVRWIGNYMYIDIMLERPDFVRAAGVIR